MKRTFDSLIIALIATAPVFTQAPVVTSTDWIANGRNFDVDVANDKIYLISDNYYELDLSGNQLYSNTNIDDTGQGTFDFGPAIEVGKDGIVHVINRNGGNGANGFNLMYSRRETNGNWSVENNLVGSAQARNYVVDIVALPGGEALYSHSGLSFDVFGPVHFYSLDGLNSTYLGNFENNGLYRVDADFRMEQYQNQLHIATGKPDPWGVVYYMDAPISASMPTDLSAGATGFSGVDDRRGQPDLKIDHSGNVFITYGDFHKVYFERYSSSGTHEISGKQVLSDLGAWHLDLGMSALGVSVTGDTLLVLGLKTGGNVETASSCAIEYTYSLNGGQNWSSVGEIPNHRTHSGEGRSRPRVRYFGHKFYIFYNNVDGGIAMTTIQVGDAPPPPPPVSLVDPVDLSLAQLTGGKNFDVEVANNRIYIVSDHYYEYNLAGEKYAEKISVDDTGQGTFDFGPALSVGSGGEVHVITRYGGNGADGFNLNYSKKLSDGSWTVDENLVGTAVPRNYVVDVVALDGGEAIYAHGSKEDVDGFGSVNFYNLNDSAVTSLGKLGRNDLYKVNSDFRMVRQQDTLHLATGKPFGEGTAYYMKGTIGGSLPASLTTGIATLEAGNGMNGMPDLTVDDTGNALVTYGSDGAVLFNRFSSDGLSDVLDNPVFDKLGDWKLGLGLSAIASSPDGDTLLAVALKTDGSLEASTCSLYYTYSKDGGENWVYPVELTGFSTNGGEGRMRPRIRYYTGRFYIFFNNVNGGISVKTIKVNELTPTKAISPVILPVADSLTASEPISIESTGSDAIYYSYTDALPDMLSTAYTIPFTMDADHTIYAIAYRSGYLPSDVVAVSKKLKGDPPPPPPVLVDPVDLSLGMLSNGKNFDVEVANDRIYVISDHYYEYNLEGTKIDENAVVVDSAQGTFDFGPAISVGSGGEVHVITRNSGTGADGFSLKYSKKQTDGAWLVANSKVGIPLPRNYVVDVVALDDGKAVFAHSALTTNDVWGSVYFYTLNGTSVSQHGEFGRNDLYRVDSDFRMERYQNKLHLATGKPDSDGVVYYMEATIGSSLPSDLASAPMSLLSGTGRRGQPDLRIDDSGNVFISYGASETVILNRYSADGSADITDNPILGDLGSWHLDLGLSAIASTPEGDTVFAVGLKTDNTKEASNSSLMYTFSLDGGLNWVYPIEITGFKTNAGEGRMRPRVKYYRGRFYLFFNNVIGGIGVKTVDLMGEAPGKATRPVILPSKDTLETYDEITLEAAGSDVIYYSFDDSTPGLASTKYTGSFTIDTERTIYAVAFKSGLLPSDVVAVNKKVHEIPPLVAPVDLTKPRLSEGKNFDVVIDNDKIYMISDHYYEFDLAGDLLSENNAVNDLGQGTLDFGPAIDVGTGGEVHIITRGTGNGENGFDLSYSKKEANGLWSVENNPLGSAEARNYVVDVVALENGKALYAHSQQTTQDVWSSVFFYNLDGTGIESLGDLGTNDLYRIDADFRMERYQDQLHLATGRPDEEGAAHYMNAPLGAGLPANLAAGEVTLTAGEGRRGQPDMRIDETGNVFVTYGSDRTVIFDRFSNDGLEEVHDLPIMNNLGSWHLNLGLSAVASTPGGDTIMVVGLRTDGSKEAAICALLYTYSFNGGRTWVYPNEIVGYMTNGGEGRMRPRLQFYRGRFYIFYNNVTGGIAVTSIDLRNLVLLKTDAPFILPFADSIFAYESITLVAANSDAIYYSFSDDTPDISSIMYEAPFTIDSDQTIYARAFRSGYLASDVVSVNKKVIITSVEGKNAMNIESLELYPVPASSILSVKTASDYTGEVILRIFSQTGKEVHQENIRKSLHETLLEINVSEWSAGVYILMIQNGQDIISKRFVVH